MASAGDYHFPIDARSVQQVRVNLDGHVPEDAIDMIETTVQIYFADDDMFGGHSLVASHTPCQGWDTQLWGG